LTLSQTSFLEETLASNLRGKSATDAARIAKYIRQLRDILLSVRMVPIKPLFDQMERTLNQYSRQAQKNVRFVVEGEDSELDKQVLGHLVGPLTQILKNAVEHGIESSEERLKAGKKPEGTLKLKAGQQGGTFFLEVEDDGRGLDMEKLKKKGMALGLFRDEKINPVRIMEMIFKPGITTLEVTEEGRGIGLDLVEEQVEDLHGSVRVQSRPGQGCKFVIKIPRSQALVEGWVVEAGKKRCLLPLSQVRKITHPLPAGKEIAAEEAALPVVDLAEWLGEKDAKGEAPFSIHVESGSQQFRILVDELHGKQQVLVKKLGKEDVNKPGIRAGAVLADGKLAWILDTKAFIKTSL
jgi:two-component system, chemotaxis family, sensor kinase CheA